MFELEIKKGVAKMKHKDVFKHWGSMQPDGVYVIPTPKKKVHKSHKQRSYYFGVVLQIILWEINAQGNNFTLETLHKTFMYNFLGMKRKEIIRSDGCVDYIEVFPSFSDADFETNEYDIVNYIENLKNWATENLGVTFPRPDKKGSKAKLLNDWKSGFFKK